MKDWGRYKIDIFGKFLIFNLKFFYYVIEDSIYFVLVEKGELM